MFKNFAFYASVALVAASFASCHRASDGQQDGSVTTKVVELDVANTLVVKLSKSVSGMLEKLQPLRLVQLILLQMLQKKVTSC